MSATTITSYPVYTAGQTLTAADLNEEHAYVVDRDRLLGRTVGFGTACGVEGTVAASPTRLVISPGLAVDQRGEAIMLVASHPHREIPLPPTPTPDQTFEFVTGTDGFSVVLVARHEPGSEEGCSERGCDGHARTDTLDADLVVVAGRLVPRADEFQQERLIKDFAPLTINSTGSVGGAFTALRQELVTRLSSTLSTAAKAVLTPLTLTSADVAAVQQYKAAYLNQVYFAALDLLRFRSLLAQTCLRDTPTPGVVLGWVHQQGGTWTWECSFRHHWEPPTGLTQALFGGGCQAPDHLWVQKLETAILSYAPPTTPPPGQPPDTRDPDVFICKSKECLRYPWPGHRYKKEWPERWVKDRPIWIDPLWDPDPTARLKSEELFEDVLGNVTQSGVIDLLDSFGVRADSVKTKIDGVIKGAGIQPRVDVMTQDQASKVPGFAFTGAPSPDDQIVLVKDTQGMLVSAGHVSATQALQQVGTGLPLAQEQATLAFKATESFKSDLKVFDSTLQTLDRDFQNFSTTQKELVHDIESMPSLLATQTLEQVAEYHVEITQAVEQQVKQTLKGVTETLADTRETVAGIADWKGTATRDLERNSVRVDTVYTQMTKGGEFVRGSVKPGVGEGMIDVLRTVRDALEATADDSQLERIRPQLAAADDGLARLEASLASGGSALDDSPETLTHVLNSLAEGLAGAGAPAAEVRAVRTRTAELGKLLGP